MLHLVDHCNDCRRRTRVFELDGTRAAFCARCIAEAIGTVGELLTAPELYEGSTAAEWLEVHRAHGAPRRVPWCGIGMVA
jgi:uncharacterized membrane protein